MGGFRVCIYMGLDPVIVFSSPQNNLLYQFPIIVSPSIHLDQLTASVHAPSFFFFFFGVIAACPPHTLKALRIV